jgi:hypothetical protein
LAAEVKLLLISNLHAFGKRQPVKKPDDLISNFFVYLFRSIEALVILHAWLTLAAAAGNLLRTS